LATPVFQISTVICSYHNSPLVCTLCAYRRGLDVIEQCLTSHPTQYRLGDGFTGKKPNKHYESTEEKRYE